MNLTELVEGCRLSLPGDSRWVSGGLDSPGCLIFCWVSTQSPPPNTCPWLALRLDLLSATLHFPPFMRDKVYQVSSDLQVL